MTDTIDVHLKGVPYLMRYQALDAAESFAKQYPDRVGLRRGSGYRSLGAIDGLYVYRTTGGRIVVIYTPAPNQ